MSESAPPRRALRWAASLVGGALLLWLASRRLQLVPQELTLARPERLAAAIALQLPYVALRSLRLRFALDPLVRSASAGRLRRLAPGLLHGSGWVSFLVILLLPLRLGELSRPLLLARAAAPGVGFAEALAAVATERVVDGLAVVALLFGGLALAPTAGVALAADVQAFGRLMTLLFVAGLVVLVALARAPAAVVRALRLRPRAAAVVDRLAAAIRPLARPAQGLPFVAVTLAYWGVTVLQLWLVLGAAGLDLGLTAAAAIVATIGLSIQLPGGPAQAGSFQLGALAGLALFLDDAALAGPGSIFTAAMYLLGLVGALTMALPGALWLRRAHAAPPPHP